MSKRGFRGGFVRNRGGYRQGFQQKRQFDKFDYDSDEDMRRESRMRVKRQFRNQGGGDAFMDDNEFGVRSRRDDLDCGFDLTPVSSSTPAAYRRRSALLDSPDSLTLGSTGVSSELLGGRASTRWLEEQLRVRETQLAMTSSLLKEQTHLLSQVGGVLSRNTAPMRRQPAPNFNTYSEKRRSDRMGNLSQKRIRTSSWSGGGRNFTRQPSHNQSGNRGLRGNVHSRGGLKRGAGSQQSTASRNVNVQQNRKNATKAAAGKSQNRRRSSTAKKNKPQYLQPEDIPEHDSSKPVGEKYIVNVQGYYCKLCNKFYQNEHSAKVMHTSQEAHYEKWKAAILQSIKDRNRNAIGTKASEDKTETKEADTSKTSVEDTNGAKEGESLETSEKSLEDMNGAKEEESMEEKTSAEPGEDEMEDEMEEEMVTVDAVEISADNLDDT
ncbi:uncharacterized protein LOC121383068 isoform X2 [Gigantopelta aegis]|uniref:uncharacterized protein LOC121383068 isoform X2 n=1 Tax=Gigantopelta aegis TaxID=1735272 RepID=UPI001B88E77F|nr:uncharacterized protein LOC121383068 isoform X2 [Gigantopelta aegis]